MKTFVSVLVGLAVIALAIAFLLVGGIEQIVHGATGTPVDATGIAVGALRVVLTGAGVWVGILVGGFLRVALGR